MASSKKVTLSVLSREQSEGVGARVRRSIGRPELKNLDPFLLFDEFKGGRPGGFPDHPHRGFETLIVIRDQRNVENIILENSDHLKWDPRNGVFQQQPRGVETHEEVRTDEEAEVFGEDPWKVEDEEGGKDGAGSGSMDPLAENTCF